MDPRHERLARNESLFREVNERINDVAVRQFGERDSSFVCECCRTDCSELLHLAAEAYEAVRAEPNRFALVRGHETPEIERVIAKHGDVFVVEKMGDTGDVAVRLDPRSR